MAASNRPVPDSTTPLSLKGVIPEANAIIRALLDEYLHYRTATSSNAQKLVNGVFGAIKTVVGDNSTSERTQICKSLLDNIQKKYLKNNFITSMLDILIVCEKQARDMQRKAAKNENAWFKSDTSMCAQALHAVRSCLYTGLKSSALKDEFETALQTKINELLAQMKTNYTSMQNNIDTVDMTDLAAERDELFGKLIALQHLPTIKEAFIQLKFDIYKPLKINVSDEFQTQHKIKLNKNIPDLFHPGYFFIYYIFHITDFADRLMEYTNRYNSYLADVIPSIIIASNESSYFTKMGGMVVTNVVPAQEIAGEKEKGTDAGNGFFNHVDSAVKPRNDEGVDNTINSGKTVDHKHSSKRR